MGYYFYKKFRIFDGRQPAPIMKKRIAYTFVVFAGFTLLLLSVLPHHHHNGRICFCQTECTEENQNSNDPCATHEHDGTAEAYCELSHLFVTSSREDHTTDADPVVDNDFHLSIFALLVSTILLERHDTEAQSIYTPYNERYTLPEIRTVRSLRAPPAFIA